MIQRFAAQFGGNTNGFDKSMLPDELFEDQALRSVRLGVLVSQIIDKQGISVDADRVTAFIAEAAENYEDPQEVIDYYTNDKEQRANIESVVLEDQVVEYVVSQSKVTDKEVKYQDLLASTQQAMM
jgi:trigger factor